MAQFQASITSANSSNGQYLVGTDTSNYDTNTEAGHARIDFADFQMVVVTDNTGVTYIFATVGAEATYSFTADVEIIPPYGASTNEFNYPVPQTIGDGVYVWNNIVIPNYDPAVTYQANDDYVFRNNVVFKCIQTGSGHTPNSSPTYWEVVDSYVDIPSKYNAQLTTYRIYDEQNTYNTLAQNIQCDSCSNCCDEDTVKATKLLHNINAITSSALFENWTQVAWLIQIGKQLIAC